MHDYQLLHNSLVLSGLLFSVGAIGFACRRDLVIVLLSAGMMLQATVIALAAYGRFYGDGSGETFGLFVLAVATILALMALAVSVFVVNRAGSRDLGRWRRLGRTASVDTSDRRSSRPANDATGTTNSETPQPDSTQASARQPHNQLKSAGDADG